MDNTINKRIATFRKALGYKQEEMAELLGMKVSTYSQKERVGNIDCDFAIRVANILEIDPVIIIFGGKSVREFIEQGNNDVTEKEDNIKKEVDEIYALKRELEILRRQLDEREIITHREKDLLTAFRNVSKERQNMIFAYAYELVKLNRKKRK